MVLYEPHLNIFKVWKWDPPSEGVVGHAKERESIGSEYVKWVAILWETEFEIGLGRQLLKNPASDDTSVVGDGAKLRKHHGPSGHQHMENHHDRSDLCTCVFILGSDDIFIFRRWHCTIFTITTRTRIWIRIRRHEWHSWSLCILLKCFNSRWTNLFSISLIFLGILRVRVLSLNSWLSSARFEVKDSFFFFLVLRWGCRGGRAHSRCH